MAEQTITTEDRGHREAKAEAKAAKARAKAMRPWYKKKRYIGGIVLLVIVVAIAGSSGGSEQEPVAAVAGDPASNQPDTFSGNSDNPPQNDVSLTNCGQDQFGFMEATVDIVNNSSKKSNYMVEVTFESPDQSEQFETGVVFTNNLEPGQKKTDTASALAEAPTHSEFTCRVTDVNRFAS